MSSSPTTPTVLEPAQEQKEEQKQQQQQQHEGVVLRSRPLAPIVEAQSSQNNYNHHNSHVLLAPPLPNQPDRSSGSFYSSSLDRLDFMSSDVNSYSEEPELEAKNLGLLPRHDEHYSYHYALPPTNPPPSSSSSHNHPLQQQQYRHHQLGVHHADDLSTTTNTVSLKSAHPTNDELLEGQFTLSRSKLTGSDQSLVHDPRTTHLPSSERKLSPPKPHHFTLPSGQIVRLNVGGRTFCTSESTLTWFGTQTFFGGLLSGRMPSTLDENGAYFIDRDPDLFAVILNFLRTKHVRFIEGISLEALFHEAEYFGIYPLMQKLECALSPTSCGGIFFHAMLEQKQHSFSTQSPIVAIASAHTSVAVAHARRVTCWTFGEATGWECVSSSPLFDRDIELIAMNVKYGPRVEHLLAISSGSRVRLWEFGPGKGDVTLESLISFDLSVQIDSLFFIGSQLVAISQTGKVGIRHSMTQNWLVQDVKPITSFDRAASMLILGCADGTIHSIDLEKFPLRMKDNDLLVTHLYSDASKSAITALSVYLTPVSTSEQCLEIAYGTAGGSVRVIIQHPETVGQPPLLFQTYSVHRFPIVKIMLSEKYLISVCSQDNHVRSWRVARFRGRISTQPGSVPIGSFSLSAQDISEAGPFGDRDAPQIFLQKLYPSTTRLLVRSASTGERICLIESVNEQAICCVALHECGMTSRVGSRAHRFVITGHIDGSSQVWDLTSAIENPRTIPKESLLQGEALDYSTWTSSSSDSSSTAQNGPPTVRRFSTSFC